MPLLGLESGLSLLHFVSVLGLAFLARYLYMGYFTVSILKSGILCLSTS